MPDYNALTSVPWTSRRSEIKKVVIEDGVTNIGRYAFMCIDNLYSVTIPNSVTSIGDKAFSECRALTSITIPNYVTCIGEYAFYNCASLTSVTIPNSVMSIGEYVFKNCSGLTSVTISNSLTSIPNEAFYGCSALTSVTIPNSVTSIGSGAFRSCTALTSINIPYGVTSIEDYALNSCVKLTSITIPSTVTSIGERAFGACNRLNLITCKASTPPDCGSNCFYNIDKSIPVYVPDNSLEEYRTKANWKDFTNIQAIPSTSAFLTDGDIFVNSSRWEFCDVTYTRTFNSTNWQALYIPFSISYDDWKDDFDVAYINGIRQLDTNDDNVIDETIMDVYRIESGSLIPNTPYLIKAKTTGEKTIFANYTTLLPSEESSIDCSTTIVKYTFTGTYRTIPAATLIDNGYYAMGGGAVIMTDGTSDLKPYRWYLKIEARSPIYNVANAAKAITIRVMDEESETTGVSELQVTNDESPIYDLNGRRVDENTLKPGIYIKNGKKVVIK